MIKEQIYENANVGTILLRHLRMVMRRPIVYLRGTAAAKREVSSSRRNRSSCRPILGGPTNINGRL